MLALFKVNQKRELTRIITELLWDEKVINLYKECVSEPLTPLIFFNSNYAVRKGLYGEDVIFNDNDDIDYIAPSNKNKSNGKKKNKENENDTDDEGVDEIEYEGMKYSTKKYSGSFNLLFSKEENVGIILNGKFHFFKLSN